MSSVESTGDAIRHARIRLQAKDALGALYILKSVIANGEQSAEIMELIGVAQGMAGNTTASRNAFEEATRLEPSRATAHYNYAVVLSRDGELEQAAEEAGAAAFLDPRHTGAAELSRQLAQQIRDRKYIGEETFQTVGNGPGPESLREGVLGGMACGVCGKKNLFSARVCRHCGTFIKEMPDLIPVE